MKRASVRAARTFAQTFVGVWLAGLLAGQADTLQAVADLSLLNSAAAAGFVAVLSLAQNLLEDTTPSADTRRFE